MWCHVHDLLDEGPDEALMRMKDAGLNAVSVAGTYHVGRFLLPHNPRRKVVILEDGVTYFQPRAKTYPKPLQPVASTLCAGGDPYETIASAAARHDMHMRAWLVMLHNSRLGSTQPTMTLQNAFGDRYLHGLCPNQPEVRDFAIALASDAALYPVRALDLEALAFMGYEHPYHHEKRGMFLSPLDSFLLSICFCPACSTLFKARGINAEICRAKVQKYITGRLRGDVSAPGTADEAQLLAAFEEILGEDGLEMLKAREATIVTLARAIRKAVRPEVEVILRTSFSPFFTGGKSALRPEAARSTGLALMFTFFGAEPRSIRAEAERIHKECADQELHAGIMACAPDTNYPSQLEERYRALGERWASISFYHYGLMPLSNLGWIRAVLDD